MIEIRAGPKRSYFLYVILLEKNKSQNNRRGTNIYHPAAVFENEVKMKEIIMQTYTIILPIVTTALMGYIVWLLKNQKHDRDANSKGTMLLLRVQLIEYHSKYTTLGDIPSYAYQNFCEMYDAYHALGGNGMVTKMKQEIEELHIKKKGN